MALRIVWRNRLPLIRTERTPQRIISNEFGAVDAVAAPDLMTEIDAIVGVVEHGLVLNMTDLAPISSGDHISTAPSEAHGLVPALFPPRAPQTSGLCRR
jgi:hypothetical protein